MKRLYVKRKMIKSKRKIIRHLKILSPRSLINLDSDEIKIYNRPKKLAI